jgi:hypothetical protein
MYALILGAIGFIFSRYFHVFLLIRTSHFWMVCCNCFWYVSVGSLFKLIMLFSCVKVSIFCCNTSLSIITIALLLSAFAIVRLLCRNHLLYLVIFTKMFLTVF